MAKDRLTVSVVIPSYNGREYLAKNLPSVLALGADEVIIVDDASTDDTSNYLKVNFPQVKLIRHQKNQRFPISVNDGFKQASGDLVVLLNQDVRPDKYLLKYAVPHFADSKTFAVTFNEDLRSWAKEDYKNGFIEYTNGPKDNTVHESAWASGGSAMFCKKYWDELGGFDPIFTPGYSEDHDLGIRARQRGYKIIWDPKAKVEHEVEKTFTKAFIPKYLTYIKERNYLLLNWKNLNKDQMVQHKKALFNRIIKHPGYIVPVVMALWKKLVS